MATLGLSAAAVLVLVQSTIPPGATDGGPAATPVPVQYRLVYERDASPPSWRVEVSAVGLSAASGEITLRLDDFGSWTSLADYYLTSLSASPPLRRDPGDPARFVMQPPPDWDGSLRVQYTLHPAESGSAIQQSYALLPRRADTYTFGCTANTLMTLHVGGGAPIGPRHVEVVAPPGWTVFSGWAGETPSPQRFTMSEHDRNGLIAMGLFTARADGTAGDVPIEVRQFGAGRVVADEILGWVRTLVPEMVRSTARTPDPVRVFLDDARGGGMMTDRGLVVHIGPDWSEQDANSPSTRLIVAHELYHTWLGGFIRCPADLVWFQEGFTDYLALWHAARAGVVPRDWFVQRLGELGRQAPRSALGEVAFADPAVRWRDNDGPNETMAYQGGHLLAFLLDVELRRRGTPDGLSALVRDLIRRFPSETTLDDLRAGLAAADAADLFDRYIAGTGVPDADALLLSIGCRRAAVPVELTYLGVRAESLDAANTPFSHRIIELDPAGPAAAAGARVGDIITGWYPARTEDISLAPEVRTPYTFGLTAFAPRIGGAFFGVRRGTDEIRIDFTPTVIPGGLLHRLEPTPALDRFFERP